MSEAYYHQIARFYDAEHNHKTDDLILYSELAAEYGEPILDIGCGTGRVLIHLAQENYKVHGIDYSPAMLDRLEIKLKSFPHLREYISCEQADILHVQHDQTYPLILLTYNMLMHFHKAEHQKLLLEQVRQWIRPDGLMVIDLPNAGEVFASQNTDAIILDDTFIDTESGNSILLQSHNMLDRTTQILQVRWIYDELQEDGLIKRTIVPNSLRYFFLSELSWLLKACGFRVAEVYGDTDGAPFEDGCPRMIIYARPD
ncbi:class I SAM-dependent methyltransferase [Anaerolineales bacterium]